MQVLDNNSWIKKNPDCHRHLYDILILRLMCILGQYTGLMA